MPLAVCEGVEYDQDMENMTITLNGRTYHSLTGMAQDSPQASSMADVLKKRGIHALDRALISFVKLQAKDPCSFEEIRNIVDDLQDFEGAIRACSDKSDKELWKNYEQTENRSKELTGQTEVQPRTLKGIEKAGYCLVDKHQNKIAQESFSDVHISGFREEPEWRYDKIGENRDDNAGLDVFAADLNAAVLHYTKAMLPEPVGTVTKEWMQQWTDHAAKATHLLSDLMRETPRLESKKSASYLLAPELNLRAYRTKKGIFGREKKEPLFWQDDSGKSIRVLAINEPVEKFGGKTEHLAIRVKPQEPSKPPVRTFVIQGKTFIMPDLPDGPVG